MSRFSLVTVANVLLIGQIAGAFEAQGTIKKVDAANGTLIIQAGRQEHNVKVAPNVTVLDTSGATLADGVKAKEIKEGAEATFTIDRSQGQPIVTAIRLGKSGSAAGAPIEGKDSVGFKPLSEMTAQDRYKGEDGGLYGSGQNDPPAALKAAAKMESEKIQPLDAAGHPNSAGIIGLISISMSNATQEFSLFKQLADKDPAKSPRVTIVDCAQGGQAMAQWVDPDARAWIEADRRLKTANVDANQVQVAWIKLANAGPTGDLAEHGKKLQRDTESVLHNAHQKFPNLRIAYLGSRIYGGYAASRLNPEPYAYEGAFAVRWLIQDQLAGKPELNCDPARGAIKSPLLLWGPYFWADGVKPRAADGLTWQRSDFGPDGTHPSESGRQKVAKMLLGFFKTDANAATWFLLH